MKFWTLILVTVAIVLTIDASPVFAAWTAQWDTREGFLVLTGPMPGDQITLSPINQNGNLQIQVSRHVPEISQVFDRIDHEGILSLLIQHGAVENDSIERFEELTEPSSPPRENSFAPAVGYTLPALQDLEVEGSQYDDEDDRESDWDDGDLLSSENNYDPFDFVLELINPTDRSTFDGLLEADGRPNAGQQAISPNATIVVAAQAAPLVRRTSGSNSAFMYMDPSSHY